MKNEKNDSYDQIKGMLNTMRNLSHKTHQSIREQVESQPQQVPQQSSGQPINNNQPEQPNGTENKDVTVINNVDVVVNSADPQDLTFNPDETGKISQLIDDFRTEVSELVDFDKLIIYPNSAKLDGKIGNVNLGFTLSAGDDEGLFLSNASFLKVDETSLDIINKLKMFSDKFSSVLNEMLANRKEN